MIDDPMRKCPRCNVAIAPGVTTCPGCSNVLAREANFEADRASNAAIDIGAWLTEGWQLFAPNAGPFVAFSVVAVVVSVAATMAFDQIPYVGWLLPTVVTAPLFAGYLVAAFKLMRGQEIAFGDFFGGFDYVVPLAVGGVIASALVTGGLLLLLVPGIYLAVGYTFMNALIVDAKLDYWPAMEASRRIVHQRWLSFAGFGAMLFLVNVVGVLALGIGLLVSMPVTYCAVAVAYSRIFGLADNATQPRH